ncbi:Bug family tripartite tricarboxylate transporter substrate binding protein [Xenophilus sp.]|uniref:Bug family tripartite tricarboxylate transporter substrate binding protein n=1 Tax=Xenophilus sp. TaxID=1873499 RepID=UPI0037DC69F1
MQHTTRRQTLAALAGATLGGLGLPARAEAYPSRPVRLVLPFPPGGSADFIARLTAERLRPIMGQPFVVDNRPGASGNLATSHVAHSPADGYTLLVGVTGALAINPWLYRGLDYVPERDFAPISMVAKAPVIVVAGPRSGIRSLGELVERAKAAPRSIAYATNGMGTSHHLAAEMFSRAAGIQLRNVPYKGTPSALQDIVGGHVDIGFMDLTASIPLVSTDRIQALAVTGATRSSALPSVPTIAESGFPGFSAETWIALFAPRGMDPADVQRLSAGVNTVFADADVRQQGTAQGLEVAGSTPAELQRYLAAESTKWRRVVETANIKLD